VTDPLESCDANEYNKEVNLLDLCCLSKLYQETIIVNNQLVSAYKTFIKKYRTACNEIESIKRENLDLKQNLEI